MKKFTKLFAMTLTVATFIFMSCGQLTGGQIKDETGNLPKVQKLINFTADSDGLFSFPNADSSARTILPGEVDTSQLDFYLTSKDQVNSKKDADPVYKDISSTFIAGNADSTGKVKTGSFSMSFALSDYVFNLYAVPTGTTVSSVSDIQSAALFVGTANADLRFNDKVTFHMKANSSSTAKGAIDITLKHENGWTIPKGYKVTVGLYNVDETGKAVVYPQLADEKDLTPIVDTTAGDKTMTSIELKFQSAEKIIDQGEYNLVVKYNKLKPDGTSIEKTFEYSEKVIILMNQTSTGTVTIPMILEQKPTAPENFKVQFKDPKDSTKNTYEVNFTWDDKSKNEREFIIDLLPLSTDTNYLKMPTSDTDWNGINQPSNVITYNRFDFDKADNRVKGSLNKNNNSATFNLELEKRYLARICASNDAGQSDWAYMTWNDTAENDWQTFDTDVQTINRFRITYNLNGGKFAAADSDGSNVTNPPALVHYASQLTNISKDNPPAASTKANVILSPDGITKQKWITDKKGVSSLQDSAAITLTKDGNYFWKWTKNAEGGSDYPTTVEVATKPTSFVNNIKYYPSTATKDDLGFLPVQPTKDTYSETEFTNIKVRTAVSDLYLDFKNLNLVANYDTTKTITVEIDDISLYELKPSKFTLAYAKDAKNLTETDPIDANETPKTVKALNNLTLGGTDAAPGKQLEVSTDKVDTITITANTSTAIPLTKYNPTSQQIEVTNGDYTKMHLTIKAINGNNVLVNADRNASSQWEISFKNWKTGTYHCEITANTDQIPDQTLSYTFTLFITQ